MSPSASRRWMPWSPSIVNAARRSLMWMLADVVTAGPRCRDDLEDAPRVEGRHGRVGLWVIAQSSVRGYSTVSPARSRRWRNAVSNAARTPLHLIDHDDLEPVTGGRACHVVLAVVWSRSRRTSVGRWIASGASRSRRKPFSERPADFRDPRDWAIKIDATVVRRGSRKTGGRSTTTWGPTSTPPAVRGSRVRELFAPTESYGPEWRHSVRVPVRRRIINGVTRTDWSIRC